MYHLISTQQVFNGSMRQQAVKYDRQVFFLVSPTLESLCTRQLVQRLMISARLVNWWYSSKAPRNFCSCGGERISSLKPMRKWNKYPAATRGYLRLSHARVSLSMICLYGNYILSQASRVEHNEGLILGWQNAFEAAAPALCWLRDFVLSITLLRTIGSLLSSSVVFNLVLIQCSLMISHLSIQRQQCFHRPLYIQSFVILDHRPSGGRLHSLERVREGITCVLIDQTYPSQTSYEQQTQSGAAKS